jgi:thermostable 8-oxoguanine DNA glycosylase
MNQTPNDASFLEYISRQLGMCVLMAHALRRSRTADVKHALNFKECSEAIQPYLDRQRELVALVRDAEGYKLAAHAARDIGLNWDSEIAILRRSCERCLNELSKTIAQIRRAFNQPLDATKVPPL